MIPYGFSGRHLGAFQVVTAECADLRSFFRRYVMLRKAYRGRLYSVQTEGFTLVELMIVVSILTLLMAILLPSLKSARDQAVQVVCAARLQQWGLAFGCYAAENNGVLPHCDGLDRQDYDPDHPDDHPANMKAWDLADWCGWVDVLPPLIAYKPWRHHPLSQFPDESTFYHCPRGRLIDGGHYDYGPETYGYFSYSMNSCLELDPNAWPPPGGVDYPMPSFLDTARIVGAARVILLFEQLLDPRKGYDGQHTYRSAGKHCGSYPKAFSARHPRYRSGLGGNVLYCDNHVEWHRSLWKPEWDSDLKVPPRSDPNWYPYPVVEKNAK